MPTEPLPELAPDFVPFATAALDFHQAINMPVAPIAAGRAELDALHAHVVALYGLLDAHTARTTPVARAEGDHLRACGIRLWQAAEHLHAAFHPARPTPRLRPPPHPRGLPVPATRGSTRTHRVPAPSDHRHPRPT